MTDIESRRLARAVVEGYPKSYTGVGAADRAELLDLERRGWRALATSGDAAAAFYREVLAARVLFLLPGGMVIDDRAQIIEAMSGPPWSTFELAEERVVPLGADGGLVAYRARARRQDVDYEALFASTYVRSGGAWKLAVHQQTPI